MESNFIRGQENNVLFDRSLVIPSAEKPEFSAIKSIGFSFFNNMISTFFKLIITTNLILLGHTLYEEKVHYQLFMTFQIGVFILEFFGKYFIMGLLKYIFFNGKQMKTLYNLYIKMKTALIFVIPIIIIPVSICSYYLIELLFKYSFEIDDLSIIKEVYKKFLLFTPIIYFFEILLFLNLKFLNELNGIAEVAMYIISYLVCHIVLSWILLFIFNFGLLGLTISYCLNSFLFFSFTNIKIYNIVLGDADDFFYIIPNKKNFDFSILSNFRKISYYSLINLGDVFPIQFLFIVSLFIGKNPLIVNIIYLNFYEVVAEIDRGFYYTIKNEIFNKFQDTIERQNYVLFFSVYYSIITLTIFLCLLIFKNMLLNIYLIDGGEPILKEIASSLIILYPLCILFMSVKIILNGIIRGMDIPVSNKRRLVYMTICIVFCYIFCFLYEFGIIGIWISMLILEFLHAGENSAKTIKHFPLGHTERYIP